MLYQVRGSGDHAVPLGNNKWRIHMDHGITFDTERNENGKAHRDYPDLDIIPVEPTKSERVMLASIYGAFNLIYAPPVDEVDQRLILIMRSIRNG